MGLNRSEIQLLKASVNLQIENIIAGFTKDYAVVGHLLVCACPIHGGDNISGFNINVNHQDSFCGKWFCNTHGCNDDYTNDILGFVQAMLESRDKGNKFYEAVDFLKRYADPNVKYEDFQSNAVNDFFARKPVVSPIGMTRSEIRKKLLIPPDYYLDRGYKYDTLDSFDVGLCLEYGRQMYQRVVFPVYNADERMIGCVGRDVTGKADSKWVNSKGFNKSAHLFNFYRAVEPARKSGKMILCEGQGDVMRLYEAGIHNAVGLFGCKISDGQQRLLESTGVFKLVIALDPDKAGQDGRDKIIARTKSLFSLVGTDLPIGRDLGDLTVDEIHKLEGIE